jgi:hypothetical protein
MNALMSPYLDGLLDGAQTRRLENHVGGCDDCRYLLELMQQIPQALQTNRMLAPRPEFTTMVMQRIVITSQLQNQNGVRTKVRSEFRSETRYTFRGDGGNSAKTDPTNEAKIVTFPSTEERQSRLSGTKSPGAYVLRFSSIAAALVVAVGIAIYSLQIGVGAQTGATASTSAGIALFAHTLTDAFQSPAEILVGGVVTVALVVTLAYYLFLRNGKNQPEESNSLTQRRDSD